jgi:phosphoribosylformylglycinamidine synthase
MGQRVRRIFVEKKKGFDIEAKQLISDLKRQLGIESIEEIRIASRYDLQGISENAYQQALPTIFSTPGVELVYEETLDVGPDYQIFGVEDLPGQYNQRADAAEQCLEILTADQRPLVKTAQIFMVKGPITADELGKIKAYCINPVASREACLAKPETLIERITPPQKVPVLDGFIQFSEDELASFKDRLGLAMSLADLLFCQAYFKQAEERDPTLTELKVLDTYWSDHCRHTTFLTEIEDVQFEAGPFAAPIQKAYAEYLETRNYVYGGEHKALCLMDLATIGMKALRKKGLLADLDLSAEVNACSINVDVEVDGQTQQWLVMFKNETHNHPTEIEPFGGAATCLGGAIRDPLSGRSYVYQAMRITGSGDPRTKIEDTLSGKLPQRTITTEAARGYSTYGNQIGIPAGQVVEIYHEGYVAKRMELGAVIAAAPKAHVVRAQPEAGDLVVLIGGRTGRDGCGGATGSSKSHTDESILTSGAEVQKGNPLIERNILRLFRKPEFSRLIKRCNDFGAGGVAVAIGELADGLEIDLDQVPTKYDGLDGTELAIAESQERMAVVIAKTDLPALEKLVAAENLEATVVAKVTADPRLVMKWRKHTILTLQRAFLDSNGVRQKTKVFIKEPTPISYFRAQFNKDQTPDLLETAWINTLKDLNIASQKGLVERFDSTAGASTVLLPFGGKYSLTPALGMAAKIPVVKGETNTCTLMTYGFNPALSTWSPFHGGLYAVLDSVTKIVAMGGDPSKIRLTFQEYFEKLGNADHKWGKPFAALLGAFQAQKGFSIPSIGGKDSMSGTFNELNVPPTLVSFAVGTADVRKVISPEFKKTNSQVIILPQTRRADETPDFARLMQTFQQVHELISKGRVLAAHNIALGGIAAAISKMSFGNKIGLVFTEDFDINNLFTPDYGGLILEIDRQEEPAALFSGLAYEKLGETTAQPVITIGSIQISLELALNAWETPLREVFPLKNDLPGTPEPLLYSGGKRGKAKIKIAKPQVLIPIFPGTNGEYELEKAFHQAGGMVEPFVFQNRTRESIQESMAILARKIQNSQIIAFPGGFSAGAEPAGAGKLIATIFRDPNLTAQVMAFLTNRDGLILGLGDGFHALLRLGLVPDGEIRPLAENTPALVGNSLGRHVSQLVRTKVVSNLSPWFNNVRVGTVFTLPVSHDAGRFVAGPEILKILGERGQIATQYVDYDGVPSYDGAFNPFGSLASIEGITSPDGRVLGKIAHSERIGHGLYKNAAGEGDQGIFAAGINYFL